MSVEDSAQLVMTIITSIGGGVALVVGLGSWLGKVLAGRLLEQDRLRAQSELERLKSILGVYAKRFETEHSQLFAKRVEVMERIFHSLIDITAQAAKSLWFVEAPRNPVAIRAQAEKLYSDIRQLGHYFDRNRIFLEEDICQSVSEAIVKGSSPAAQYICYLGNYEDHELHTLKDVRDRCWDEVANEVRPAIDKVEQRFRSIVLAHINAANKPVEPT